MSSLLQGLLITPVCVWAFVSNCVRVRSRDQWYASDGVRLGTQREEHRCCDLGLLFVLQFCFVIWKVNWFAFLKYKCASGLNKCPHESWKCAEGTNWDATTGRPNKRTDGVNYTTQVLPWRTNPHKNWIVHLNEKRKKNMTKLSAVHQKLSIDQRQLETKDVRGNHTSL